MAKKKEEYGNESIKSLKGADRVRKRPAVIFGSDGVEGCAHSIFEIVSRVFSAYKFCTVVFSCLLLTAYCSWPAWKRWTASLWK